jgi:hypothetical protein
VVTDITQETLISVVLVLGITNVKERLIFENLIVAQIFKNIFSLGFRSSVIRRCQSVSGCRNEQGTSELVSDCGAQSARF